jgi:hypothetical protein|mmetsp:Transcript_57807/g.94932  ORF Transcript_57807/g.94932 Transcript_57807/m.94932 type:complete len:87 (+) Transcript_57807:394-654(+)
MAVLNAMQRLFGGGFMEGPQSDAGPFFGSPRGRNCLHGMQAAEEVQAFVESKQVRFVFQSSDCMGLQRGNHLMADPIFLGLNCTNG